MFLAAAEAAEARDVKGKLRHPFAERVIVLFGQDRGRNEHPHLEAVVDRLKGCSHRQLSLSETDVAAQQAVHWAARLHILFNLSDCRELIGSLLVRKRRVKLALPLAIRDESDSWAALAGCLEVKHFSRHVANGRLGCFLLTLPGNAAQARQAGPFSRSAHVLLHEVDLRGRHVELCTLGELDL